MFSDTVFGGLCQPDKGVPVFFKFITDLCGLDLQETTDRTALKSFSFLYARPKIHDVRLLILYSTPNYLKPTNISKHLF